MKNSRRVSPVRGVRATLNPQLSSVRKAKGKDGCGGRAGKRDSGRWDSLGKGLAEGTFLFQCQNLMCSRKRDGEKGLFLTHRNVILKQGCIDPQEAPVSPLQASPVPSFLDGSAALQAFDATLSL